MLQLRSPLPLPQHPVNHLDGLAPLWSQPRDAFAETLDLPNCPGFHRSYRLLTLSTATTLRSLDSFPLTKCFAWLQLDGSSVLTLETLKTLKLKPTSSALTHTPLIPIWSRFEFHSLPKSLIDRISWSNALPLNWKMSRSAKAGLNPTPLDLCVPGLFGCTRQDVSECRACLLRTGCVKVISSSKSLESSFSAWSSRVLLGSRVLVSFDLLNIYLCRGQLITLVWRIASQNHMNNSDPSLWRFLLPASVVSNYCISPKFRLFQPQRITRLKLGIMIPPLWSGEYRCLARFSSSVPCSKPYNLLIIYLLKSSTLGLKTSGIMTTTPRSSGYHNLFKLLPFNLKAATTLVVTGNQSTLNPAHTFGKALPCVDLLTLMRSSALNFSSPSSLRIKTMAIFPSIDLLMEAASICLDLIGSRLLPSFRSIALKHFISLATIYPCTLVAFEFGVCPPLLLLNLCYWLCMFLSI